MGNPLLCVPVMSRASLFIFKCTFVLLPKKQYNIGKRRCVAEASTIHNCPPYKLYVTTKRSYYIFCKIQNSKFVVLFIRKTEYFQLIYQNYGLLLITVFCVVISYDFTGKLLGLSESI